MIVSIGTSGVVSAISEHATADPTGIVAGFADATGRFLPLVCTLNAALVLDSTARLLGVSHDELSALALSAPAGADGLVLVPYFDGERTPNRPDATGSLLGLGTRTRARHIWPGRRSRGCCAAWPTGWTHCASRAWRCDGCCWSAAGRARRRCAVSPLRSSRRRSSCRRRASTSPTVRRARRRGCSPGATEAPQWQRGAAETFEADPVPAVRERYAEVRDLTASRG